MHCCLSHTRISKSCLSALYVHVCSQHTCTCMCTVLMLLTYMYVHCVAHIHVQMCICTCDSLLHQAIRVSFHLILEIEPLSTAEYSSVTLFPRGQRRSSIIINYINVRTCRLESMMYHVKCMYLYTVYALTVQITYNI